MPSYLHATCPAPAATAVELKRERFNATLVIESPYNGPPSKEVDAAWTALLDSELNHDECISACTLALTSMLLSDMNIAVPKSDLDRIDTASIPIPDTKSMYFAGLSVFHELHCLVRLGPSSIPILFVTTSAYQAAW